MKLDDITRDTHLRMQIKQHCVRIKLHVVAILKAHNAPRSVAGCEVQVRRISENRMWRCKSLEHDHWLHWSNYFKPDPAPQFQSGSVQRLRSPWQRREKESVFCLQSPSANNDLCIFLFTQIQSCLTNGANFSYAMLCLYILATTTRTSNKIYKRS